MVVMYDTDAFMVVVVYVMAKGNVLGVVWYTVNLCNVQCYSCVVI